MDAVWQWLGDAAGTKGVGVNRVRVEPGSSRRLPTRTARPRSSSSSSPARASRGRTARCTRCGRSTASSTRPTTSSTRSSPGPTGSSTSSSARATRRSSAGCRARGRSGSASRGSRDATTTRGTSRRPASRSSTAIRRRGRRTSSTSTRSSASVAQRHRHRAARDARALDNSRACTGSASTPDRRGTYPHCHSAEEEIFVILDGTATLELWHARRLDRGDAAARRPSRCAAARHAASPTPSAPARTA